MTMPSSTELSDQRQDEIFNTLTGILLPNSDLSLIQAGLIRNVRVIDNDVYVRLFHGSDQTFLVKQVNKCLVDLSWSNRVVVDTRTIPGVKRTVAVGSGKGGVGKTSVTVGLAYSLREQGFNVGILDADVYGPNISTVLGLDASSVETVETDRVQFVPLQIDGIKVMSVGMLAEQDQSLAWRGPILTRLLKQFLFDVVWGELDFLLIDLPPGTGDAQITLLQECPLASVLLVGVPGHSSRADLTRTISMYRQFDLPLMGYVENFSSIQCPHCGVSFNFLLDQIENDLDVGIHVDMEVIAHLPVTPDLLSQHKKVSPKTLNMVHPNPFQSLALRCGQLLTHN